MSRLFWLLGRDHGEISSSARPDLLAAEVWYASGAGVAASAFCHDSPAAPPS